MSLTTLKATDRAAYIQYTIFSGVGCVLISVREEIIHGFSHSKTIQYCVTSSGFNLLERIKEVFGYEWELCQILELVEIKLSRLNLGEVGPAPVGALHVVTITCHEFPKQTPALDALRTHTQTFP